MILFWTKIVDEPLGMIYGWHGDNSLNATLIQASTGETKLVVISLNKRWLIITRRRTT